MEAALAEALQKAETATKEKETAETNLRNIHDTLLHEALKKLEQNTCVYCGSKTLKPIAILCTCKFVMCCECAITVASNIWYVSPEIAAKAKSDHKKFALQFQRTKTCPCNKSHKISAFADFLMGTDNYFARKTEDEYKELHDAWTLCTVNGKKIIVSDASPDCIFQHHGCNHKNEKPLDYIRHVFDCSFRQFPCLLTRIPSMEDNISHDTDKPRICKEMIQWGPPTTKDKDHAVVRLKNAVLQQHFMKCGNRAHASSTDDASNQHSYGCVRCSASAERIYGHQPSKIFTMQWLGGIPLNETFERHVAHHKVFDAFRRILGLITEDFAVMSLRNIPINKADVDKAYDILNTLIPVVKQCLPFYIRGELGGELGGEVKANNIPDKADDLLKLVMNNDPKFEWSLFKEPPKKDEEEEEKEIQEIVNNSSSPSNPHSTASNQPTTSAAVLSASNHHNPSSSSSSAVLSSVHSALSVPLAPLPPIQLPQLPQSPQLSQLPLSPDILQRTVSAAINITFPPSSYVSPPPSNRGPHQSPPPQPLRPRRGYRIVVPYS